MAVQIFSSDNGGKSWSPGVQTIAGEFDGTKMAIHPSQSKVYFAAAKFTEDMKVDVFLTTCGKGDGIGRSTVIDSQGKMRSFTQPVVLSNGTLVVPMAGESGEAWVYVSTTEGQTFSGPFPVTKKLGRAKGYFQLVVDQSQSPTRDRVYFIRAAGPAGQYDGIWVNASSDGGQTWSSDIRVDSVASQPQGQAIVPSAAVNNAGVLCVSWVDRRHDPRKNDLYATLSLDGGKTFIAPVRVTDISSDPATPGNADVANKFPGGGHYLAMAAKPDGSFQLVWSDSRTGVFQLQTCTLKPEKSEK
ncbi:MAG: exo-alpha-sialidase [Acidobacteria bacterium]|nr:exo-alpha-sialidase [Acidobacteriota bacterium]